MFVGQEFRIDAVGFTSHFPEKTQPQDAHPLFRRRFGDKLGEFHQHKFKALDHFPAVFPVHYGVVVVIVVFAGRVGVIENGQAVYGRYSVVFHPLFRQPHVSLGCVQQHPAFELQVPVVLHFHKEYPPRAVRALDVYDGIFPDRRQGQLFGRDIADVRNAAPIRKRQQRVEETLRQLGVFAEHFLEGYVPLRV